jgi:hypothetical protein
VLTAILFSSVTLTDYNRLGPVAHFAQKVLRQYIHHFPEKQLQGKWGYAVTFRK